MGPTRGKGGIQKRPLSSILIFFFLSSILVSSRDSRRPSFPFFFPKLPLKLLTRYIYIYLNLGLSSNFPSLSSVQYRYGVWDLIEEDWWPFQESEVQGDGSLGTRWIWTVIYREMCYQVKAWAPRFFIITSRPFSSKRTPE